MWPKSIKQALNLGLTIPKHFQGFKVFNIHCPVILLTTTLHGWVQYCRGTIPALVPPPNQKEIGVCSHKPGSSLAINQVNLSHLQEELMQILWLQFNVGQAVIFNWSEVIKIRVQHGFNWLFVNSFGPSSLRLIAYPGVRLGYAV